MRDVCNILVEILQGGMDERILLLHSENKTEHIFMVLKLQLALLQQVLKLSWEDDGPSHTKSLHSQLIMVSTELEAYCSEMSLLIRFCSLEMNEFSNHIQH